MASKLDILREARERYQAGIDADRDNRKRDQEDRQFYTGGENQWPAAAVKERRAESRPCETYNRLPQFVKQVTGEIRQNKPAIKVLPVDDEADPEIANIYSAIIRHIESNGDGHRVYAKETEKAVIGGVGWCRVKADYYDDDSFEQELCIEGIPNPNAVVGDPDAREATRCDMSWAFVTELVSRKKFEAQYPNAPVTDWDKSDTNLSNWLQGDFVRIAEYWTKEKTGTKKLYAFQMPDGSTKTLDEDEIRQQVASFEGIDPEASQGKIADVVEIGLSHLAAHGVDVQVKGVRDVPIFEVSSILMCGTDLLGERQKWPGKYIPLVRVVGEEVEAGDTVFRYGLVHHAKPPQMAYNYARNAMMERHATSTKSPWLIALKQIPDAFKHMWEKANVKNWPFLPYNPAPDAPPPQRIAPPQIDAAAYQESMVASEDMKAVTGIYDASLGARSNETSGVAIRNRTAQGDTATYVFIDNMEAMITAVGRILVDLIPYYYSNERVIRIIGEDGEIEKFEAINKLMPDGKKWNDISRGKFDVVVSTGPAYATRRAEMREALIDYARIDPPFVNIARDQIIRAMDFPGADKMADRAALMLPPGIDEDADKKRMEAQQQQQQNAGPPQPSPEQQQAMIDQQVQQVKLQREREASQAKIEMAREESANQMQLEREKFEFSKQMQWQELELQREIALEKLGIDRMVASHDAILDTATAAHAAVLDTAEAQHSADMDEQTQQAAE